MVAVEAASHGVPTVAFETGGVVDAISQGRSGYLVPPGDYSAFAQSVVDTLERGDAMSDSCQEFAKQFTWTKFGQQLFEYIVARIDMANHVDEIRYGKG